MTQLERGDVLEDRYVVDAVIARGGMATVYRCVDRRLGRSVAAKVLFDHLADDEAVTSRFKREARAMAQLNHPNLVNVYDTGSSGEHVFLIMELIDGGTLRELLQERGPMPPHAAISVLRHVLTGLSVAHNAQLVHRDIKPDNILITSDGRVKLADFGLVRAADALTVPDGTIVGTVKYLSPEQVTGEPIGPASDVYQAGIVLFEMLTGTTPYSGSTPLDVARARLKRPVTPPSEVIDGIDPEIDELVAFLCADDPRLRPADAQAALNEVNAVAVELDLPPFTPPAPQAAAAARAAASAPEDPTSVLTTIVRTPQAGSDDMPTAIIPRLNDDDSTGAVVMPTTILSGDQLSPEGADHATTVLGAAGVAGIAGAVTGAAGAGVAGASAAAGAAGAAGAAPRQGYDDVAPETTVFPQDDDVPGQHRADLVESASPAAPARVSATNPARANKKIAPARQVENRSGAKLALWLAFVTVVILAVALGAWWFGSGRYGEIPQVVGQPAASAQQSLEDAGYKTSTREVFDNATPVGSVVATSPKAGASLPFGQPVTVLISRGQPTVPPIVDSRNLDEYGQVLSEYSLNWSTAQPVYNSDIPAGHVVEVSPAPGTPVAAGAQVSVVLSKGPQPVVVPMVRGRNEEEASRILTDAGLKIAGVREEFDKNIAHGDLITTDPGPGVSAPDGSDVTLVVSRARAVPDVTGLPQLEAEKRLTEAGFTIGRMMPSTTKGAGDHEVLATTPAAGTLVDTTDTQVDVMISDSLRMPNFVGMPFDQAVKLAEKLGIVLDSPAPPAPNTAIATQKPAPGSEAHSGDRVTLTLAP